MHITAVVAAGPVVGDTAAVAMEVAIDTVVGTVVGMEAVTGTVAGMGVVTGMLDTDMAVDTVAMVTGMVAMGIDMAAGTAAMAWVFFSLLATTEVTASA